MRTEPLFTRNIKYICTRKISQSSKEALNEVSDYIIKEKGEEVITNTEGKKNENTENTVELKKEKVELKVKKEKVEIRTEVKPEIKEETSSDFTEVNFDDLGKD